MHCKNDKIKPALRHRRLGLVKHRLWKAATDWDGWVVGLTFQQIFQTDIRGLFTSEAKFCDLD
jgi:hypothetical protein